MLACATNDGTGESVQRRDPPAASDTTARRLYAPAGGAAAVQTVTDSSFEADAERWPGTAVVVFHALWSAPDRAYMPVVDAFASAHGDSVRVVKLDVDASHRTAAKYGVRSVPTTMFLRGGRRLGEIVGLVSLPALEAAFAKHAR